MAAWLNPFFGILATLILSIVPARPLVAQEEAVPLAQLSEVRFGPVLNKRPFDTKDFTGKVVVVDRWGINSVACKNFMPELVKLHRRYSKKGLAIVGIEVQSGPWNQVNEFLDDERVEFPVVSGGTTPARSGFVPFALVFGADGNLDWAGNPTQDGFVDAIRDALKEVEEESDSLLPEEPAPIIASRVWTNDEGQTIEAEVLRVEGDEVVFRMKDRNEVAYAIGRLSPRDQLVIRRAERQPGAR